MHTNLQAESHCTVLLFWTLVQPSPLERKNRQTICTTALYLLTFIFWHHVASQRWLPKSKNPTLESCTKNKSVISVQELLAQSLNSGRLLLQQQQQQDEVLGAPRCSRRCLLPVASWPTHPSFLPLTGIKRKEKKSPVTKAGGQGGGGGNGGVSDEAIPGGQ